MNFWKDYLTRTPERRARVERAATRWAQRQGYRGDQLPVGRMGSKGGNCPLENAVGGRVCRNGWEAPVRVSQYDGFVVGGVRLLPLLVRAFIWGFDRSRFPLYVDEPLTMAGYEPMLEAPSADRDGQLVA